MKIPLEITYRYLKPDKNINSFIQAKFTTLQNICNGLTAQKSDEHESDSNFMSLSDQAIIISNCYVIIEKAQEYAKKGLSWRAAISLKIFPEHQLSVVRNPDYGKEYEPLESVIEDAFEAAQQQLRDFQQSLQPQQVNQLCRQ